MKRPVVRVIGQSGNDLIPSWSERLLAVRFTDNEGGEADEIEIDLSVTPAEADPPAEGTEYRLFYGWEASALKDAGTFTYQNAGLTFDAEGGGWVLTIVARSADFVDAEKSADSEHFEETTAGEIFKKLASDVGKAAKIHPSLAAITIPYRLRMQQSAVGFAQALAEELGGTLKLAKGQWLLTMKNSGETAGGSAIPPIFLSADNVSACDLNTEASPKHGKVEVSHFDEEKGFSLLEAVTGLGKAARFVSLHPAPSLDEAKVRSKAQALELSRETITGSVTVDGDPAAMAGAAVMLTGFGSWNGHDLVAPSIQHEFTFDDSGGWQMTVECAARTQSG
ncbi:contractile injection system protein, VgrG/Pvc8 family [Rhizobium sp. CECT 9324]|uniref:phage late control D family protein n=1 Tax=Rhizobium sp. CECT 9324 TaxID=2845820 RepID=UPI001E4CB4BA|nr:contractile injection system protein, VgrG/Pvc8 family [Rhizobium sp. CECT 9324]CAH0339560.1 hypothetical protein RHI9324_01211 [Rhizobium sp. CECT 9324]